MGALLTFTSILVTLWFTPAAGATTLPQESSTNHPVHNGDDTTSHRKTQTLKVNDDASPPPVTVDSYVATSEKQLHGMAAIRSIASKAANIASDRRKAELWETSSRAAIINDAQRYVGRVPYIFGGESPSGWDCSGFTKYILNETLGIQVEHSVIRQHAEGTAVSQADAKPGDLVIFSSAQEENYHIGIYAGHDTMIVSPREGQNTKVSTIYIQAGDKIDFVSVLDLAPNLPAQYNW